MKRRRLDWGLLVVVLFSMPAVIPLTRPGYFVTHDGLLHLYRLLGLDLSVRSGVFYPRWFPDFAFGYGQPVLNFYGPLSYYVAEALNLTGMGLISGMKATYALFTVLAGMTMYVFSRSLFAGRRPPAVAASLAYVYAPYHLANLYVRGALAELAAMAWVPLLFWSLTRLLITRRSLYVIAFGVCLACLIYTHSLSLLIVLPMLLIYAICMALWRRQWPAATRFLAGLFLAASLSAPYWLPALLESQYVGLREGRSSGYIEHLLAPAQLIAASFTYQYFPKAGNIGTHPVGLIQLLWTLPGLLILWPAKSLNLKRETLFMLLAVAGGLFMMSSFSRPLWKMFEPALAYLQYPWRFQIAITFGAAVLAGLGVSWVSNRANLSAWAGWGGTSFIVATLALSALLALPYQALAVDDEQITLERMWAEERDAGQIGTTWTGEYLPVWVREQRWAIGRSWRDAGGPDLREGNGLHAPQKLTFVAEGGLQTLWAFRVQDDRPSTLVLHQFYYPGMQARWGDITIPARPYGILGLAAFDLPPARDLLVTIEWGVLPARQAGIMLWGLGVLMALVLSGLTKKPRVFALGAVVIALWVGCVLVVQGWAPACPPIWPVNAELEGKVALVGYSLSAPSAQPGRPLEVTLYWLARQGFSQDLVAFVHLANHATAPPTAQSDGQPGGGFTPTSRWVAGEIVPDRHVITLPADLPAGPYLLLAGMYEYSPRRNLAVAVDQSVTADRVILGTIEVTAP